MDFPAVYLDHAAATPVRGEVAAAMAEVAAVAYANPSSQHAAGRRAKQLLEDAREKILGLVGGRTSGPTRDRLIFTSGATEANRTAMLGLAAEGCRVAVSARDHPSITSAAAELAARGHAVRTIPLDTDGNVALHGLADEIDEPGAHGLLLAISPVCGQTGILHDPKALPCETFGNQTAPGKHVSPRDSPFATVTLHVHADATQAAAWYPLDFATSPFASMTLAPHKFGGPRGIGCVVVRGGVAIAPLLPGSQELGLRGGTEAVVLAVGFAKALEISASDRAEVSRRVRNLREDFESGVLRVAHAAGFDGKIIGQRVKRAPHIAAISIPGIDRQTLVMAADLEGVCLSTGTACASGSSEPAPILFALRLDDKTIAGTFRASLGRTTTAEDIAQSLGRLGRVFSRMTRS